MSAGARRAASLREYLGADLAVGAEFRAEYARFDADALALEALLERLAGRAANENDSAAALPSVVKYFGSEFNKKRHELLMRAGGLDAFVCDTLGEFAGDAGFHCRELQQHTFGGF